LTNDVSYWVASHLTGIFEIRDESNDLLRKGSRGAGLSIPVVEFFLMQRRDQKAKQW
jgi:pantoate kinase